MELSEKLRQARDLMGMTREELAVKSEVSYSHICLLEQGKTTPTVSVLEKIEAALGLKKGKLYV
ncbi:MAG: hypothetical protein DRH26_01410 [Deltaproteobacteria bacterium]|nr:MAG: hypothetical protein DRH26_01410 [Deltaproteobacteria bacterium]